MTTLRMFFGDVHAGFWRRVSEDAMGQTVAAATERGKDILVRPFPPYAIMHPVPRWHIVHTRTSERHAKHTVSISRCFLSEGEQFGKWRAGLRPFNGRCCCALECALVAHRASSTSAIDCASSDDAIFSGCAAWC